MKLPYLQPVERRQRQVVSFGGLNYGEDRRDGELAECRNLSAGKWPALSQRAGRGAAGTWHGPTALFAWQGKLVVVDGTTLWYDGQSMGELTAGEKQFAVVNTKLCIFPDKKYLDLESSVLEDLGAEWSLAEGTSAQFSGNILTFEQVHTVRTNTGQAHLLYGPGERQRYYIKTYSGVTWKGNGQYELTGERVDWALNDSTMRSLRGRYVLFRAQAREDVGALEVNFRVLYWTDNMGVGINDIENWQEDSAYEPVDRRGYFGRITAVTDEREESLGGGATLSTWDLTVEVVDGRLSNVPMDDRFKVGDRVDIRGAGEANCLEHAAVQAVSDYSITFKGAEFTAETVTGGLSVVREVPDLELVCENENRLWGCQGHIIYASALGDPTNFYIYDGLSTDSYTVAVGTDGAFTGCAAYSGDVLFFKERVLHKLIGSYPAEYAMYTYTIPGIQAGSHKSAVTINEVLYYKGVDGIYAYAGGTPQLVSRCFGLRRFRGASAGTDGERYLVSMEETGDGGWGLYVFDPATGVWLREDESRVPDFARADGRLYFLSGDTVYQAGGQEEGGIPWMARFAPFTETVQQRKRYSRLYLRLELEAGAWAQLEVSCDGGPWATAWRGWGDRRRSFAVPVRPRRCDSFSVRLSGQGGCVLRSMTREFTLGSGV